MANNPAAARSRHRANDNWQENDDPPGVCYPLLDRDERDFRVLDIEPAEKRSPTYIDRD